MALTSPSQPFYFYIGPATALLQGLHSAYIVRTIVALVGCIILILFNILQNFCGKNCADSEFSQPFPATPGFLIISNCVILTNYREYDNFLLAG
jgi:lipopolysaccharide export LptBFGC system permease protein LptF